MLRSLPSVFAAAAKVFSFRQKIYTGIGCLLLCLSLNGCFGGPTPLSVASIAFSGISLATSGKTVGDHALSMVRNEDCSVWRVMVMQPICRPFESDAPTFYALLDRNTHYPSGIYSEPDGSANIHIDTSVAKGEDVPSDPYQLAEIDTAAGASSPEADLGAGNDRMADINPADMDAAHARFLFVLSSLPTRDAATAMAQDHSTLSPQIIGSAVSDGAGYHVVVGPYSYSELGAAWQRASDAGLRDFWMLRLDGLG